LADKIEMSAGGEHSDKGKKTGVKEVKKSSKVGSKNLRPQKKDNCGNLNNYKEYY